MTPNTSRELVLRRLLGDDYRGQLQARRLTPYNIIQRLRETGRYKDSTIALFLAPLRKEGLIVPSNRELDLKTKTPKPRRVALKRDALTYANSEKFIHGVLDYLTLPTTTRAKYECAIVCILLFLDSHVRPMEVGEFDAEIQPLKLRSIALADYEVKTFLLSPNAKVRPGKFIKSTADAINKAFVASYISTCHKAPDRALGIRYVEQMSRDGTLTKIVSTWTKLSTLAFPKEKRRAVAYKWRLLAAITKGTQRCSHREKIVKTSTFDAQNAIFDDEQAHRVLVEFADKYATPSVRRDFPDVVRPSPQGKRSGRVDEDIAKIECPTTRKVVELCVLRVTSPKDASTLNVHHVIE